MGKLFSHSKIYLASKVLSAVFSYLSVFVFLRFAGKEEYGKLSLIYSIILFSNTFSSGWIIQTILRFNKNKKLHNSLNQYILKFKTLSIFVGIIAILVASKFLDMSAFKIVISLVLYILIFNYSVNLACLQSNLKVQSYLKFEVGRNFLILTIPLFLSIWFNFNSTVILAGILGAYIIVFFSISLNKSAQKNSSKWANNFSSRDNLKTFLRYGIPIGLWLGIAYLINIIDRYMILYYFDYSKVGMYSAIYDVIYKSLGLFFVPILSAAQPLIMNSWHTEQSKSKLYLKKAIRYELILYPVILIILIIFNPILALSLSIPKEIVLYLSVPILFGVFFWQLSMLIHKPLELNNQTIKMLIFALFALSANFIGNLFLIPIFGMYGAAYTTIISSLLYIFLVQISSLKVTSSYA